MYNSKAVAFYMGNYLIYISYMYATVYHLLYVIKILNEIKFLQDYYDSSRFYHEHIYYMQ